jgi:hypothetical protein
MTDSSPITPPPELVQQWMTEFYGTPVVPGEACTDLATRAAQWGADQELEACCGWLENVDCDDPQETAKLLRAARRPKPPSLKEQALAELVDAYDEDKIDDSTYDTIRRALEQLDD